MQTSHGIDCLPCLNENGPPACPPYRSLSNRHDQGAKAILSEYKSFEHSSKPKPAPGADFQRSTVTSRGLSQKFDAFEERRGRITTRFRTPRHRQSTREISSTGKSKGRLVLSEHAPQRLGDLAQGCINSDRIQNGGQQVATSLRCILQSGQLLTHLPAIP